MIAIMVHDFPSESTDGRPHFAKSSIGELNPYFPSYHLVNVYITMENHHVFEKKGKSPIMRSFSIAMLDYRRVTSFNHHLTTKKHD